ncbi:hypothetical protein CG419_03955 [Latilactobacillus curvatus]|uniref:Uncharacterized protein n=1 Tax=Latilactobacillus curvatus TaxID=28038 RepID=A0AAC9UQS0_LATCU|nr:hypothetical protein [Latilactobacillus curvatus]ASN59829.1 hypothetical protein CG419_03955 [Latilactobacillus curvatus]
MYKTIKAFTDKNPNSVDENGKKQIYWIDDTYPVKGGYVGATTKARINELIDTGLIEEVEEDGEN